MQELFRRRIERRYEDESGCWRNKGCVRSPGSICHTPNAPRPSATPPRLKTRPRLCSQLPQVAQTAAVVDPQRVCDSTQRHDGKGALTRPPARIAIPNRFCCVGTCARGPGAVVDGGGGWPLGKLCLHLCRADAGRDHTPVAAGQSTRPGQRPRSSTTRVAGGSSRIPTAVADQLAPPEPQSGGDGLAWPMAGRVARPPIWHPATELPARPAP